MGKQIKRILRDSKKGILLVSLTIAIFIFTMVFVSAQAPNSGDVLIAFPEGLEIVPSLEQTIQINEDYTVNFFLYNTSNGLAIDDSATNCTFYMADNRGVLVNSGAVAYTTYWSYLILGGNFSSLGNYDYGISCQSPSQGGAYVGFFDVTYAGLYLKEGQGILYASLFLILIFFFTITLLGINQLPASNQRDEEGKILSITYLKYFRPIGWMFMYMLIVAILYLSSNLAFVYLNEQLFAEILFVLFRLSFMFSPVVVVVWIIWIYRQMFHDRELQSLLNRGFFPQGKL